MVKGNILALSHPHLREEFLYCIDKHDKKDEANTFNTLNTHSERMALWKCPKITCGCEHIYKAQIAIRTNKQHPSRCLFCLNRQICQHNSFAAKQPELLKEWGDNNTIQPTDIAEKSGLSVLWKCLKSECKHHIWTATPHNRVLGKTGCPFCEGKQVCICNSFATKQPEMTLEWCDNNTLKPSDIPEKSGITIQWKCLKSNCNHHVWKSTPHKRVISKTKCPYCANRKTCPCYCLASEFPDLLNDEWDEKKNDEEGLDIFKLAPYSSRFAWWICKNCQNSWTTQISSRTYGGNNCPKCCRSKMEKSMFNVLQYLKDNNIIKIFISEWRLINTKMYADFMIYTQNNKQIILEMDGVQHFTAISFGTSKKTAEESFIQVKYRDQQKKQWCKTNNIRLLRLSYLVKHEHYETELLEFISNKNVDFRLVGQPI